MSNVPIHLNISSDVPSLSNMRPQNSNKWQASRTSSEPPSSGIADLYDVVNAIGSMTINDVDDCEANLIMDLARARRDIVNAEKKLADCIVREQEVMTSLSRYKSVISKRKLDKADVGLGHMRVTFKKHGLSHQPAHGSLDSFASCRQLTIQLD
ncbi:uncharacterized protein F5891DRAFT_1190579 [Suillus fuscotomentosus]|uniref:Uncharacterized protein n=1 Tax=Suillus fuscotomentosus TaxID=1912939 RepID=A0AAD4E2F6_9AGAM|nr:uncharacterized protein F5891DRAFT_1198434 [Suillus fuscotomentosus]XP_041218464.1 uncharacterized protein F5891DRAFT_1197075 [Suillus fuscotomentosus]XP_041222578.1 uncharacterized protein F5891DRAFT_1192416 [Suillus fuscotomentosus]XP_041222639.1 uncharacterized protein F5891DRAFT_1192241 [Suillus fuscotomentosus]XP_041224366.1 uncharacterized protein F5891DRAFT_1190579 [Suillus fuscotomentosus]KAG1837397.1 hypothetical protein C8R48DRAFT_782717 [Suillus tomentosus]KAG1850030.1 hypotheti